MSARELNGQDYDILNALDACAVRGYRTGTTHEWVRPLDLGGRGPWRYATLTRLVRRGLVETRKRGERRGVTGALFVTTGGGKGSRVYRITTEGLALLVHRRKVLSS